MFAFLFAAAIAAQPVNFAEDFSSYSQNRCIKEGAAFGPWRVQFDGFGCAKLQGGSSSRFLCVDTAVSRKKRETHAVFVSGPGFTAPLDLQARVRTVRQLRRGRPNSWEVGWLVWDYVDNDHFYYFVPRTNGWELGKRDPAYPKGQRSLASGSKPSFRLGRWNSIRVVQDADQGLGVYVHGNQIAYYRDAERPYLAGKIGFYDEDSRACIGNIVVFGKASGESL